MNPSILAAEWLESDGLGGFASGTVSTIRTRRYHALLISATRPPDGRMALVKGYDAWLETKEGNIPLSENRYQGQELDFLNPCSIQGFEKEPWPKWTFASEHGYEIKCELFMPHQASAVFLRWKMIKGPTSSVKLCVRPFFAVADFHTLHHANDAFCFDATEEGKQVSWLPYADAPGIIAKSNGAFSQETYWYNNFSYAEEEARGLDHLEDLAAPGTFSYTLTKRKSAELSFASSDYKSVLKKAAASVRKRELKRRSDFPNPVHKAADCYKVKRGKGSTIIAGYPWFADWGRDTFIAMRGILLATGRLKEARDILLQWAGTVHEGVLPNRFPDYGEQLEYNSVDAALWFVIAAHEYLELQPEAKKTEIKKLQKAITSILKGYSNGTMYQIQMEDDGLLSCGIPNIQLTWMDAKVGDWVVTPRIGKPVEIQALWINALTIAATFDSRWDKVSQKAKASFEEKFWNEEAQSLYDVVDNDHEVGTKDPAIRPNQIFAIGGLPFPILSEKRALQVFKTVEEHLYTPYGLRTISPESPHYQPRYEGGILERDGAYHQGTVWPWLMGPYVEAYLRTSTKKVNKAAAKKKFLGALYEHLDTAGLGHISEIFDADSPHAPRGTPFQAWSIGELIRIESLLSQ